MPPDLHTSMSKMLAKPFRIRPSFSIEYSIPYICPSCRHRKHSSSIAPRAPPGQPFHRRNASTIAPVTSVNAAKQILPSAQELHEALARLRQDAEAYTDQGQLDLALKGLESRDAPTKIARKEETYCRSFKLLMLDSAWLAWFTRGSKACKGFACRSFIS